jgi:cold shock CspA family protein
MSDAERLTGIVHNWDNETGWGFVRPDDEGNPDIWFHIRSIVAHRWPQRGSRVSYTVGRDRYGRTEAQHVEVIRA